MEQVVILMAAYQGERYLAEQIESILAQDYKNWKLVVQDDGSVDGTLALLEKYRKKCPDKIFVRKNEENMGATRNFLSLLQSCCEEEGNAKHFQMPSDDGAGDASRRMPIPCEAKPAGESPQYYMFADQDDIWHPDKISKTLERMKRLERKYGSDCLNLVFTDATVVGADGRMLASSFFESQHLAVKKRTFCHLLMENLVIGCTVMINHALAAECCGLSLPLQWHGMPWYGLPWYGIPLHARYHDWWVALLASALGHTSYLAEAMMDYRQHGSNAVGSQDFAEYVKGRWKSLKSQKSSLEANYRQAEEFRKLYGDKLPAHYRRQLEKFCKLRDMGFFGRRIAAVRWGFLKSGLARNIGLMLIL